MTKQEVINLDSFREEYKNNPVAFAEEFLGVELYPWQKVLFNAWNGFEKGKKYICNMPFRNGKRMLAEAQLEDIKTMEVDLWIMKEDCYEKYEKGILVKTMERRRL